MSSDTTIYPPAPAPRPCGVCGGEHTPTLGVRGKQSPARWCAHCGSVCLGGRWLSPTTWDRAQKGTAA